MTISKPTNWKGISIGDFVFSADECGFQAGVMKSRGRVIEIKVYEWTAEERADLNNPRFEVFYRTDSGKIIGNYDRIERKE